MLKEYRRKGIATALKIKAIERLLKKGITEVRTDNEEYNPMYKIKFRAQEKGLTFELNGEHTWRDEKIKLSLEAGPHRLRVYYLDELFDDQIIIADRNAEFIYTRYQPEPGSN